MRASSHTFAHAERLITVGVGCVAVITISYTLLFLFLLPNKSRSHLHVENVSPEEVTVDVMWGNERSRRHIPSMSNSSIEGRPQGTARVEVIARFVSSLRYHCLSSLLSLDMAIMLNPLECWPWLVLHLCTVFNIALGGTSELAWLGSIHARNHMRSHSRTRDMVP